jgi:hypothetical protein
LKFCPSCTVCLCNCPPPVCPDKQADQQKKITASGNTVCYQINNWDDLRSRRQLLLALKDGTLAKIANLQPTPDPLPADWNLDGFLNQIEGKFVNQVDTFRACAEYTQAQQLKEEDVGTWHTRVLQLHTRAWHRAVDREISHELIYKFCCGLYHPMVRAKTVENNPETFGAALQGAMQAEASQMMLASGLWGTWGSAAGGPANNAMINAMRSGGGYVEMRECHTCHQVGHLARKCPKGSAPATGTAIANKGQFPLAFFARVSPSAMAPPPNCSLCFSLARDLARKAKGAVGQRSHRGRRNASQKRECNRPLRVVTLPKRRRVGLTRRGRSRNPIRVLMAQCKRPGLMPLENLSLVTDSCMGRETDMAGNHVSG